MISICCDGELGEGFWSIPRDGTFFHLETSSLLVTSMWAVHQTSSGEGNFERQNSRQAE